MAILDTFKLALGARLEGPDTDERDLQLQLILDNAQAFIASDSGRDSWHDSLPHKAQGLQLHIAVGMFNTQGIEGSTYALEGGAAWSSNLLQPWIKRWLNSLRTGKLVRINAVPTS
ncbi:hypothetical protein FACS1894184_19480 [Clostridia bacterium]|nr:hypothetical protein FACS1894184_19480 [Clostridia bacterium]